MYALLTHAEIGHKPFFHRSFKSKDDLNPMESSNSNPGRYRNHLPWPIAEKNALASTSISLLPPRTPSATRSSI